MLKTIEYYVFQLLANSILPNKPECQLVFSYDSIACTVSPPSLKADADNIQINKGGTFCITRYNTNQLDEVIYSVMMANPEKYELHTDLINDVLSVESEGFDSMYLKGYYQDLANQVADEGKDQYTEVMKELSPGNHAIEKFMDCFVDFRLPFSAESFSEKVFGSTSNKFQLVTFDGWDGNSKELIISDENQMIYLELIYS